MIYRKDIDGLRAISILPVVFYHAGFPSFSGGFLGVDIFFVISGFLITSIIISALEDDIFSFKEFYLRRARRLLPGLILVILFSCCVSVFIMHPSQLLEFSRSSMSALFFGSNFFFWSETGYFMTAAELKPLLHTWSLAIEEQYYLLAPAALLILFNSFRRILVPTLIFAVCLSFLIGDYLSFRSPNAAFFLLPTRAWEIGCGALVALNYRQFGEITKDWQKEILSLLGLMAIIVAILFYSTNTPMPGRYALLPVLGTCLLLFFGEKTKITSTLLGAKSLVWIGLLSYSIYLWHQPLLAFGRIYLETDFELWVTPILAFTFGLAILSFYLVEKPLRHSKSAPRNFIILIAVSSTAIILFWVAAESTDGFSGRYKNYSRQIAAPVNMNSGYTDRRFLELEEQKFSDAVNVPRVLIVGDSFGKDVTNILFEAKLDEAFSVSTYYIPSVCGNVWTERTKEVDAMAARNCDVNNGWRKLSSSMPFKSADHIWLVSSWQDWQLPFLAETLMKLKRASNASIKVFSLKQFEEPRINKYLDMSESERVRYRWELPAHIVTRNKKIENLVGEEVFVDLVDLYCERNACRIFDDDGHLISYDGEHLTPEGAYFFADHKLLEFYGFSGASDHSE